MDIAVPVPGGPVAPRLCLGRSQRLVASRLFDEAYAQGRKYVGRHLVLFLRTGDGAQLRLGVVTGRKIGAAPVRTRARRRLREVFRRERSTLRGDFDVVLLARSGVDRVAWDRLVADFREVARRAGLLGRD